MPPNWPVLGPDLAAHGEGGRQTTAGPLPPPPAMYSCRRGGGRGRTRRNGMYSWSVQTKPCFDVLIKASTARRARSSRWVWYSTPSLVLRCGRYSAHRRAGGGDAGTPASPPGGNTPSLANGMRERNKSARGGQQQAFPRRMLHARGKVALADSRRAHGGRGREPLAGQAAVVGA